MARKMRAYGENEHPGKYVLDDYDFSRNHTKAVAIRRWKRNLKKKSTEQYASAVTQGKSIVLN